MGSTSLILACIMMSFTRFGYSIQVIHLHGLQSGFHAWVYTFLRQGTTDSCLFLMLLAAWTHKRRGQKRSIHPCRHHGRSRIILGRLAFSFGGYLSEPFDGAYLLSLDGSLFCTDVCLFSQDFNSPTCLVSSFCPPGNGKQ